jgi:predicted transcriptional regulator YdeE
MNVKLEHKEAFQVIGFSAHIRPEEGYVKCPEFWEREYAQKYARLFATMKPENEAEQAILDNRIGMLALCIEGKDDFEYMIAGVYQGGAVPEGMKIFDFAESDWAVFTAKGSLPASLQQLNTEIWQTWYPTEGQAFEPNGGATVEYYSVGNQLAADYECGMWIPVRRK